MKTRTKRLVLCATGFLAMAGAGILMATPSDATATCSISVTVDQIMEWDANFPPISLADITHQTHQVTDTASATLYTNGDVDLKADNTNAARLHSAGGVALVTEYSLAYDGNGVAATGGSPVSYTGYDTFLSTASRITHVSGSGAVLVTLGVRASNQSGIEGDATAYTAIQTLTASWVE